MFKKIVAGFLVCLFVCSSFCSCGKSAVKQSNESLTFRFWQYGGESPDYQEWKSAIDKYRREYPDVEVNVELVEVNPEEETDQYYQKLTADLIAGKGPDVLFYNTNFAHQTDIYKMQRSGAFADMTAFMEDDPDFRMEDYHQAVFDGARLQNKLCVVPVSYQIPLFLSTQELLDEAGIYPERCVDSAALLREIRSYWERNATNQEARRIFNVPKLFQWFYRYMGIDLIDFENRTVNAKADGFREAMEFWKEISPHEPQGPSGEALLPNASAFQGVFWMERRESVTAFGPFGYNSYFSNISYLQGYGTPVVFPWRDHNGRIQAQLAVGAMVSSASPNQQNAWDFIKILLGNENQLNLCAEGAGIPVMKRVWEPFFDINWPDKYPEEYSLWNNRDEKIVFTVHTVDRSYLEPFLAWQEEIAGLSMEYPLSTSLYDEHLMKYVAGEQSYEDMEREVQNLLEIYISE